LDKNKKTPSTNEAKNPGFTANKIWTLQQMEIDDEELDL
jgi:hypothetical protein